MANEDIKKPLSEWKTDYEDDTSTISTIIRSLGLGGIAIIWVFKQTINNHETIPQQLLKPLLFIIWGLGFDLLQYLWKGINTYIFYWISERKYDNGKISDEDIADIKIGSYVPVVAWIFFLLKIVFIIAAFYNIYIYLTVLQVIK